MGAFWGRLWGPKAGFSDYRTAIWGRLCAPKLGFPRLKPATWGKTLEEMEVGRVRKTGVTCNALIRAFERARAYRGAIAALLRFFPPGDGRTSPPFFLIESMAT